MPAKIPQLKALLQKFEDEQEQLGQKIESLRAKIKDKTKKGRDSQSRKKKQEKKEKKIASLKPVISIAATTADAETQNVGPEISEIEAERQEETQNDNKGLVDAWSKANEAKATAEKTVQKLKSLRANDKARSEKITATRREVQSHKIRAAELEIIAIFAEDDLQETTQRQTAVTGEASIVDEVSDSVEEACASPIMYDDYDSLGSRVSPCPQSNDSLVVPEFFPLPTPAPTTTSPTTNPSSPIKEEIFTAKGTKNEPVIVSNDMNIYQMDRERDRRLTARYEKEMTAKNPLADLITEHIKYLQSNGPTILKSIKVTEYTLMTLFENVWLDDDIINLYAELVVETDPHFQVISPIKINWELMGLNREGGPQEPYPSFDMKPEVKSLVIPAFVNDNHWMLCVARLPYANSRDGTLDWYDSMNDATYRPLCKAYAQDVVRVLLWLATIPKSPLGGVSWKLNECKSGRQTNSDDCGVFVAANVTAVVLDTPIPQNVKGFRMQIASQIIKAVRGETLDWTTIKYMLALAARVERALTGDNDGDDNDKDEDDMTVMVVESEKMMETDYLCNICWYHYASSGETLATHKSEKHNTDPFICEWPGCRAVMTEQASLDTHYRHIHERKTYYCPIQHCHLRFVTEDEWWEHVRDQHPETEDISPSILEERYRTFDLAEMRLLREKYQNIWKTKCGSEDQEHIKIASFYEAYHSPTTRNYFDQRGLLGQTFDTQARHCRTVDRRYGKASEDQYRDPKAKYKLGLTYTHVTKVWCWWVLLLH